MVIGLGVAHVWRRYDQARPTKAATKSAASVASGQSATSGGSNTSATAVQVVLGASWAPYQQGYGASSPSEINNGGDPTGIVQNITWKNWGGAEATGTGTGTYVAPDSTVSRGVSAPVTVVAFNLGTCQGKQSYNAVEWYFPQHGGTFNSSNYRNACTGEEVGN